MKQLSFNSIFHLLKQDNEYLTHNLSHYLDKDIYFYTILSLKEFSDKVKIIIYFDKYRPSIIELKNIIAKINNSNLNTIINKPFFFNSQIYFELYQILKVDQELSQKFVNIILNNSKPNYLIKL